MIAVIILSFAVIALGLDNLPFPPLPAGPYQCPHVWGPWSKSKWTIKPSGSPVSGWGKIQRRVCEQCNQEEERIV